MPRLQDQLDTITANTRELVQPERLAVTDNAVQTLLDSGIESRILPVGATAPTFALHDALTKKLVRSSDLLAVGTLIVGILFYGEPSTAMRLGSASLIVLGIIGLKLAHG